MLVDLESVYVSRSLTKGFILKCDSLRSGSCNLVAEDLWGASLFNNMYLLTVHRKVCYYGSPVHNIRPYL